MAVHRFPTDWPNFNIKTFKDLTGVYNQLKDFVRAIEEFRARIIKVGNDHADRLTPTSASGVPSSTPSDINLFYLDTSAKDMYISVGTSSSADWKKITP